MQKREPLLQSLWEYKLIQPLWKTVWGFLKKLIPLLGIYPEETKIEKEYLLKFIVMTSLVVQRLRLCTPNAGGRDSIPGQGTRSHMLRLKPSAAKKPDKPKFHSCVPHCLPATYLTSNCRSWTVGSRTYLSGKSIIILELRRKKWYISWTLCARHCVGPYGCLDDWARLLLSSCSRYSRQDVTARDYYKTKSSMI